MKRVILESPYAGELVLNVLYARACLRDSLARGEAPIASHLLYTQPGVLDDNDPEERQQGIDAGLSWRAAAEATVVYVDFGISRGMQYGIEAMLGAGKPVEQRKLPPAVLREISLKAQTIENEIMATARNSQKPLDQIRHETVFGLGAL
jgi:hypothetical protein